jgi:[acyl-carrier-protein] S-malonyltransferase
MTDSAEAFRPVLEAVTFRDPAVPLYSNVTGKQITSGAEAKKLAFAQITSPVRWTEEEAAIAQAGIEACLEAGPGKVLQGLWRDSGSAIPCFLAGTADDISKIAI